MQTTTPILTIADLQAEKLRVRARMEERKRLLTLKMYELPAEMAAAGANSIIPSFLRGKVTDAALTGGKKLINKLVVPHSKERNMANNVSKGIGLARGIRKLASMFLKR